jgi:2-amino-4-hydroxy-6-hydroxymethyldihydropteridine diphosphokinase
VGQDEFLNACLLVETEHEPDDLLGACKAVEVEMGRDLDAPRHSARPIDVDLLLIEGREHSSAKLQVPHTDLMRRRFVLQPLLELDPPDRDRLEAALAAIEGQQVKPFGDF